MMNLFSSKTTWPRSAPPRRLSRQPASAQTSNVRVNIPFGFFAGDRTFGGGRIVSSQDGAMRRTCRIVSTATGAVSYLHILPVADFPEPEWLREGDGSVCKGKRAIYSSGCLGSRAPWRATRYCVPTVPLSPPRTLPFAKLLPAATKAGSPRPGRWNSAICPPASVHFPQEFLKARRIPQRIQVAVALIPSLLPDALCVTQASKASRPHRSAPAARRRNPRCRAA